MAARRPASPLSAPDIVETRIARLGADGDGIALLPDGIPLYAPGVLPGELVRLRPVARRGEGWAASVEAVLEPAPDRAEPPCLHFGACGGCTLQHWNDAPYAAWKRGLLIAALRRAGFVTPDVGALVRTPPASRRRVDLALRRVGAKVLVGLHPRQSREVIDLTECPVLHPALVALLAPLRGLLPRLHALRREGSAIINLLDSGPDLLLRTDAALDAEDRAVLAAFARAQHLPRISWAEGTAPPEPACVLHPATTMLSGVTVAPPPGAFLQASAEGEAAIVASVLAGLPARVPPKARVIELFAGCGTITFALAARARVTAYEGDAAALACLRAASAGRRIEAVLRDLARQPLTERELTGATAVVLDPPFAGAAAQMPQIAAARVPRVIYVSCNPAALARDARILRAAGYGLVSAVPIDQFLWSSRLESVVVFGLSR